MIRGVAPPAAAARLAALAPLALLVAYGVAFASAALGAALPVLDDHPGQLYRLWHVVTLGPAPWTWNWGWWAGYPELQFYPPGFTYLGALVHGASLGAVTVEGAYQLLVWLAYLAPGVTAWVALRRALRDGWLALPGAFIALTLSLWPALMSGVEGGVRVGMAPARLGWALVPLLAVALARWSEGGAAGPGGAAILVTAAIVLTHPAHAPTAVALLALAALASPGRPRRLAWALGVLAAAALLTAFWTLPLVMRLEHTRALAWGMLTARTLSETMLAHPLVLALLVTAVAALRLGRTAYERVLARSPWAVAALVALDTLLLEPRGLAWLPADRVMDGFWLTLVLAAGVGVGRLLQRLADRRRVPVVVATAAAVAAAIVLSLAGHETLALWPRAGAWPSYAATERGLRLPALWAALRAAPPGRVLFVRSAVPLVYGTDWWRPHTHVTALTPRATGRAIINGTFTHPSPLAALLYRGDAGPGPIRHLVERLDGRALFGRPLEELDAATLDAHARRLGVSVVVALDEDLPRLAALTDNAAFARRLTVPPFVLWLGTPAAPPQRLGPDTWQVRIEAGPDVWSSARVAYYPLWRATADGAPLETRRGAAGDLEVRAPAGATTIELRYRAGLVEWTGLGLTAVGALAWLRAGGRSGRAAQAGP
jgi:hypothetical protein